jgi:ABC-type multidrug transport system fused ATPase/permease subunit
MKWIHQLLVICRKEWLRLLGLTAAMLIMAVLETLGVASILPFMRLVADPSILEKSELLQGVRDAFGVESVTSLTLLLGVGLLILILVSNSFTAFTTWLMFKVAWDQNHRLGLRLLERYLNRPYSYFLQKNTSNLAKNVLTEVGSVIQGIMLPAMRLLSNVLVACLLIGLLAFVNLELVLIVGGTLGTTYALFYTLLRRKQHKLGLKRFHENGRRFQAANEALTGIKDVKILGREASFLERFRRPSRRYTRAAASNQIVSKLPRYAMETIAFGGLLVILLYSIHTAAGISDTLPMLSLYAFAGYRLMPALSEIFSSAVQVRFNAPALEDLYQELRGYEAITPVRSAANEKGNNGAMLCNSLILKNVSFKYEDAQSYALRDVNLEIPRNQTVGLVGRTGAGKTTLVDVILGLLEPTAGTVEIDGEPLNGARFRDWSKVCGYVPQVLFLCDSTIKENIAFGVPEEEIDTGRVEEAARIAQIHEFVEGLPIGYETVVGERGVRLSGGQRQRIAIARALYNDPEILVLDEATSSLDGATEAAVMEVINNLGRTKTLIIVAHRLSTIQACDSIHVIQGGRNVVCGTYDELAQSHHQFRVLAGIDDARDKSAILQEVPANPPM